MEKALDAFPQLENKAKETKGPSSKQTSPDKY